MWSFDVFFDLRLNKELSKQSRRRWFESLSTDTAVVLRLPKCLENNPELYV